MKTNPLILTIALSAVVALGTGCDKQESTSTSTGSDRSETKNTLSAVADKAGETASQVATEVKEAANKIGTEVKQAADTATATATAKVESLKAEAQGLIDKAKSLVNDQRYEDALNTLKQLSNFSLTPEQQKTVDDLKAQLQKLASSSVVTNTASRLNTLLKN